MKNILLVMLIGSSACAMNASHVTATSEEIAVYNRRNVLVKDTLNEIRRSIVDELMDMAPVMCAKPNIVHQELCKNAQMRMDQVNTISGKAIQVLDKVDIEQDFNRIFKHKMISVVDRLVAAMKAFSEENNIERSETFSQSYEEFETALKIRGHPFAYNGNAMVRAVNNALEQAHIRAKEQEKKYAKSFVQSYDQCADEHALLIAQEQQKNAQAQMREIAREEKARKKAEQSEEAKRLKDIELAKQQAVMQGISAKIQEESRAKAKERNVKKQQIVSPLIVDGLSPTNVKVAALADILERVTKLCDDYPMPEVMIERLSKYAQELSPFLGGAQSAELRSCSTSACAIYEKFKSKKSVLGFDKAQIITLRMATGITNIAAEFNQVVEGVARYELNKNLLKAYMENLLNYSRTSSNISTLTNVVNFMHDDVLLFVEGSVKNTLKERIDSIKQCIEQDEKGALSLSEPFIKLSISIVSVMFKALDASQSVEDTNLKIERLLLAQEKGNASTTATTTSSSSSGSSVSTSSVVRVIEPMQEKQNADFIAHIIAQTNTWICEIKTKPSIPLLEEIYASCIKKIEGASFIDDAWKNSLHQRIKEAQTKIEEFKEFMKDHPTPNEQDVEHLKNTLPTLARTCAATVFVVQQHAQKIQQNVDERG